MQQTQATSPATTSSTGGRWLALGVLTALGGLAAAVAQFVVVKQLATPWYAPVLATVGVLLIAVALFRKMTLARGLILVLTTVLAAMEWYVLVIFTQLPAYAGPARQGQDVPAFTTTFADGSRFSDPDLRGTSNSALLFFRGRW